MTTPNDPKRLRVRIDAQPEAVFKALTEPDAMTEWLAESAEVDLPAQRYEFWGRYTPLGDRPRQKVLAAVPGQSLRLAWDLDGAEPSTVDITLAAEGPDTVVSVVHSSLPATGPAGPTAMDCFWLVSLANLAAHCEGLPTTPPFDFSAPAQEAALARTVIDVPAEEVYASLLDPAQVDRWAKGKAVIEPTVGGRYDFGGDSGPVQLTELDPDKAIAYTWRHPGSPETLVRWQLRGVRGSTFLTLVHSGFADDELAEQYRQGWPGHLVELKRMLELGQRWEPLAV